MGQSRQILWLPVTIWKDGQYVESYAEICRSFCFFTGPQTKDQLVVDGIELGTKLSAEKLVGGSMGSTNHL